MRIVVPKKHFYVGEMVPVELMAFFPGDMQASVTGLPVLGSEAFTLNQLEQKPERAEQVVSGKNYTVLTWHSAISAVKAGDYSLDAEMPATVVIQERGARGSADLFDDFFNDPTFGQGQTKEITLKSEPELMKVMPLPAADRPKDFSGAVGQFQVQATASTARAAAGDPITLLLKISGAGNFNRVSTEMAVSKDGWKTYKPKSTFEPADSAGYEGSKTFEQIIIPNDPSLTVIPELFVQFFRSRDGTVRYANDQANSAHGERDNCQRQRRAHESEFAALDGQAGNARSGVQ